MNPRSVLVVDDDRAMRETLASLFREQGHRVEEAARADEALARLADEEFDVVVSDVRVPGRSGIALVHELLRLRPETPVVVVTAPGSPRSAVEVMGAGAFTCVPKPLEPEAALLALERALERRALEEENRALRRAVEQTASLGDLVGTSPAMRDVAALIRKIAHGRSPVLITGERGTGKEVVARTIHFHGNRASHPFVPIHCTAVPEALLESDLFGHVRGAFGGAHTAKRGLFEKANGGTLFLDEIAALGLGLQSKLLQALQDREVRPVGGAQATKVDVRIVAATHEDLEREMREGRFREDLYYRLAVIPIHIPPLRERPEDVPALAEAFLRKHDESGRRRLSSEAIARLVAHPWRGNARELENVIERAVALADADEIGADDLPLGEPRAEPPERSVESFVRGSAQRNLTLRELQDLYIDEVLRRTRGNKVRAASILGIDRKTLYRRAERKGRAAEKESA